MEEPLSKHITVSKLLFILFAAAAPVMPLASCASKLTANINGSALDAVTETEYMDSVNDFKDSLESVLDYEIDLEKEKHGGFFFDTEELHEMSQDDKLGKIISVSDSGQGKIFEFDINIDNYENLDEIFPAIANEKIKTYLADYNRDMTEDEYLEMIDFVFGENASKDLEASTIDITFLCDDGFASCYRLQSEDDNTLHLNLRLIDFLLLKRPISFGFTTN